MVTDADVLKRWKYIAQDDEKLLILIGGPGSGKSKLIRELTSRTAGKSVKPGNSLTMNFWKFLAPTARIRPLPWYRQQSTASMPVSSWLITWNFCSHRSWTSTPSPCWRSWAGNARSSSAGAAVWKAIPCTLNTMAIRNMLNSSSTTRITSFAWMNKGRFHRPSSL